MWNFIKRKVPKPKEPEVPVKKEPKFLGLKLKFSEGENIPMKGIWFKIKEVQPESLVLVPDSLTWKHAKRLKEAKNADG